MSDPIFRNFHRILHLEAEKFPAGLSLDSTGGLVNPDRSCRNGNDGGSQADPYRDRVLHDGAVAGLDGREV